MATGDDQKPEPRFAGFESIPIDVVVRVGSTHCRLKRLTALRPGEVLRLDRSVGRPFDLVADGRTLARVEPVADDTAVVLKAVELEEEHDGGD